MKHSWNLFFLNVVDCGVSISLRFDALNTETANSPLTSLPKHLRLEWVACYVNWAVVLTWPKSINRTVNSWFAIQRTIRFKINIGWTVAISKILSPKSSSAKTIVTTWWQFWSTQWNFFHSSLICHVIYYFSWNINVGDITGGTLKAFQEKSKFNHADKCSFTCFPWHFR